ncbi:hypothetical protein GCM10009820_03130 [Leifsonia soli]
MRRHDRTGPDGLNLREDTVPLRRQAEEMRDLYANEIAAAVHEGRTPTAHQLASWARYRAMAASDDPAQLIPSSSPPETGRS